MINRAARPGGHLDDHSLVHWMRLSLLSSSDPSSYFVVRYCSKKVKRADKGMKWGVWEIFSFYNVVSPPSPSWVDSGVIWNHHVLWLKGYGAAVEDPSPYYFEINKLRYCLELDWGTCRPWCSVFNGLSWILLCQWHLPRASIFGSPQISEQKGEAEAPSPVIRSQISLMKARWLDVGFGIDLK